MKTVIAAIVFERGKVLLMRRAAGQSNAGLWEFPGGKVEVGECERECLQREMREETSVVGIATDFVAQSFYVYPGGEICLKAYVFKRIAGQFALRVHDALDWVSASELTQYPLSPADVPIAQAIADYISSS